MKEKYARLNSTRIKNNRIINEGAGYKGCKGKSTGDTVCGSEARQKTKDMGAERNWNRGRGSRAKSKTIDMGAEFNWNKGHGSRAKWEQGT